MQSEVRYFIQKYLFNKETNEFMLGNKDYKNPVKKKIDKKYKEVFDYKMFSIPNEIKCKVLALHPDIVDYVAITETKKSYLDNDLTIVSKLLLPKNKKSEINYYGIQNIFDRINFLFLKNSFSVYNLIFFI